MKTWSFGTHILSKEISACIFRSLLGNIDLMIFQIVFFSRDKISSSTALWHVEKKTFMHSKQQNDAILS